MEIGKILLPLKIEMGRLTRLPLFDVANATAGQLVESLLMHKSFEHRAIIPNKPDDAMAQERELGPIKGAFVKLPQPGIYENMVVFDFRGLYPSDNHLAQYRPVHARPAEIRAGFGMLHFARTGTGSPKSRAGSSRQCLRSSSRCAAR